jgi:acid stress chaperone HdeB
MNKFRYVYVTLAQITCDQLILFKVAQPHDIAMWLSGYYNGKRNSTLVDVKKLTEYTDSVEKYCINNSKMTVMEAVEKVLGPRN